MDVSPSGGLGICSAGDGKMWIWDTANGETRVMPNTCLYVYKYCYRCVIPFVEIRTHNVEYTYLCHLKFTSVAGALI